MKKTIYTTTFAILSLTLASFAFWQEKKVTLFLIGDSTLADYTQFDNYQSERFPVTGWGQVFQQFFVPDSLLQIQGLTATDSVVVDDRAMGGRSTRTFFEEGRWSKVFQELKPGDLVMMQFGHNDAAKEKPERYVNIEGYQEYLRLFVNQTRQKKAIPIILTPVTRNFPWKDGSLGSAHGEYPDAARAVAEELNVKLIDLTELSRKSFTQTGEEYVSENYFMNLPPGKYEAYPDGQSDNTHFQPAGAEAVAQIVFDAMKNL